MKVGVAGRNECKLQVGTPIASICLMNCVGHIGQGYLYALILFNIPHFFSESIPNFLSPGAPLHGGQSGTLSLHLFCTVFPVNQVFINAGNESVLLQRVALEAESLMTS